MKEYFQILKKLRTNLINLLCFELLYRAALFAAVLQGARIWFNYALKRMGYSYLTAENYPVFIRNGWTLAGLAVFLVVILAALFLEICVISKSWFYGFAGQSRGIRETDPRLLEQAGALRFSRLKTVRLVYLPSVRPYFLSAVVTSLGLAWKSGVAAEVLCRPAWAVGTQIVQARDYLETPSLFAWTLVIILISAVFERLVLFSLSRLCPQKGEGKHEAADS